MCDILRNKSIGNAIDLISTYSLYAFSIASGSVTGTVLLLTYVSAQTASQLGGTRLVSSRQYISKYGSASTTDFPHVTMSAEEAETTPKR